MDQAHAVDRTTHTTTLRSRRGAVTAVGLAALALIASACSAESREAGSDGVGSRSDGLTADDPGALVRVTMTSQVGVTLDEIPQGLRDRVVAQLLAKPNSFWKTRAQTQAEHTGYRLTYRGFFYNPPRKMMPITRPDQWKIDLDSAGAKRRSFQGHDVVTINYTLTTTILTDAASPGSSEPRLKRIGGVWDEEYSLPLDPEFLYQRTGNACIDEDGYPRNTADSENARMLFDDTCDVETPDTASCHLSDPLPTESCVDALTNHVGRVDTALHFERLAWNPNLANQVRTLNPSINGAPDLVPRKDGLEENRVIYRYIPADSCAIKEKCVSGSGWRRLLQFTASIQNRGSKPLAVGSTEPDSPLSQHNVFEFSACHQHYHFSHYGEFKYGTLPGDKRAFCVESTARWANNETSPLVHEFSCSNQGIATGWGDDYIAGVECQWIDITTVKKNTTNNLSFQINPDKFLCEGTPVTDAQGNLLFEPTQFTTETGAPVDRPMCTFNNTALTNDLLTTPVDVPAKGGFVTSACTRGQSGPLRNCDFKESEIRSCVPGKQVTLHCHSSAAAPRQVVRVCEASTLLGGTSCTYEDALANTANNDPTIKFTCPIARDATERGGKYAIYTAPVVNGDARANVDCD